jgi:hypothetical protein
MPQFCGSLVRSTQPDEQQVWLLLQPPEPLQRHWLPTQTLPFWQGGLHWLVVHLPSTHASPGGHWVPQSPQCLGSVDGSKQPAPPGEPGAQQTWLPVQFAVPLHEHAPFVQVSPMRQTLAHEPQWVTPWLTQLLPQQSCPSAHWVVPHRHWPPEQTSPAGHFVPQAPQLLGSLLVLAQPDAQQVSPAAQMTPLHAHAPPAQASGAPHALPHVPQLASLVFTSTHAPLQQTSGKLQDPVVPHGHEPLVEHLPLLQQSVEGPHAEPPPH